MKKNVLTQSAPLIWFLSLASLILGPLFKRGNIFFLDWFFVPGQPIHWEAYLVQKSLWISLPFELIVHGLSSLLPVDVVQKIILLLLFFLIGYVVWWCLPETLGPEVRLVAGTFAIVNPFVYERFMVGQVHLLFGYALMPLLFVSLWRYLQAERHRGVWAVILVWTGQILFATHYIVLSGVVIVLALFVSAIGEVYQSFQRGQPFFFHWYEYVKQHLPLRSWDKCWRVFAAAMLVHGWWIFFAIFPGQGVGQFGTADFSAYEASPDPRYGLLLNLLGLYGFWRERTAAIEIFLAKDQWSLWPLFLLPFFFLLSCGLRRLWKEKRYAYLGSLGLISMAALVFAAGPHATLIGPINEYLFLHVPGFRGLRESQKFLVLLLFVYTTGVAYGTAYILQGKSRCQRILISSVIILFLSWYSFPFWWGAHGQIRVRPYPASFQQAKWQLNQDKMRLPVLILPWHKYVIGHPLAEGRTIVDPLPDFFYPYPVIASLDPEVSGTDSPLRTIDKEILHVLEAPSPEAWYAFFTRNHIEYIFVTKNNSPASTVNYQLFFSGERFFRMTEDAYGVLFRFTPSL